MFYDYFESPLGRLLLVADDEGLTQLDLPHAKKPTEVAADWTQSPTHLANVRQQLSEYFAGSRQHFDLTLHARGTAFQLAVWQALRGIDYAHTNSYADIAKRIERPRAVRAVGAANGANPLAIIVPCHRVIGSDGSLTGYGGGLPAKRWLLAHERAHAPVHALELHA
ncbi:MAG: methylated-DNA--[protein]-cysteine S-methyltransferase [Xanthomonadales bacterium]|nr:methylated-DNA--[protein]-cysteine S-methyltransferase [Xanthomonadales bacterium]